MFLPVIFKRALTAEGGVPLTIGRGGVIDLSTINSALVHAVYLLAI